MCISVKKDKKELLLQLKRKKNVIDNKKNPGKANAFKQICH